MNYFNIKEILDVGKEDHDIRYFLAFGQRGPGKSTSSCIAMLEEYMKTKHPFVVIRRYDDDWSSISGITYMDVLYQNELNINYIKELTGGEYDRVFYYGHRWYLAKYDEDKDKIIKGDIFAYAVAMNTWEKYKSMQIQCDWCIFEEFIGTQYLSNEFPFFLNMLATIFRNKPGKVIMLANSIAYYNCPYFKEMGIMQKVEEMNVGDIIVFNNGRNRLKYIIKYTLPIDSEEKREANIMYEFTDSAAARMITQGEWDITPKFPIIPDMNKGREKAEKIRIKPMNVIYKLYLKYMYNIIQGDVVLLDSNRYFLYFHNCFYADTLDDIDNIDTCLVYDLDPHVENNFRRNIIKGTDNLTKKIADFFVKDMVFCDSLKTSEILYNYIESI